MYSSENIAGRRLSLFVPDLLFGLRFIKDIPSQDIPDLTTLRLLFTRGSKNRHNFDDIYQAVCCLSGIEITAHKDTPIAAITAALQHDNINQDNSSNFYIYAEPVIMRADRDNVVLIDSLQNSSELNSDQLLTVNESEQFINEINFHFKEEPWTLLLANNGCWYFELESKYNISTTVLSKVVLKNTQAYTAYGKDERYWRKIITEIEMLLFSSAINANRMDQGKYTVNSLWLWGGGYIPAVSKTRVDIIAGDSIFLESVAQFINVPYNNVSTQSSLEQLLIDKNSSILLVNSILSVSWRQQNLYDWFLELKKMEINYFQVIVNSLLNKELDYFDLYLDDNVLLTITRKNVKAWWRRLKSLRQLSYLFQ